MRGPVRTCSRLSDAFLLLALLAPAVDAFCESTYGGMFRPGTEGGVEVGNTLTALMVGYVAVHMLVFWDVDLLLIKFIAGLFVTNCIGSIGYHSIRDANLGRMDFDSMCVPWPGLSARRARGDDRAHSLYAPSDSTSLAPAYRLLAGCSRRG